jgi:predicted site-specific integrase-resolvase
LVVFTKTLDYLNTQSIVELMSTQKVPVVILVRVSTQKQETDRQISELRAYADSKGYEVLEMCKETVSGRADECDRSGLERAKELARFGKIKKVLVHEVSRLARKNSITHKFVETLEECGVSLEWRLVKLNAFLGGCGVRGPAFAGAA